MKMIYMLNSINISKIKTTFLEKESVVTKVDNQQITDLSLMIASVNMTMQ